VSTPARQTLSIAIVAKNEEANLRRILPTIAPWADEIVLVDSGSSDETVAVAESFGARVLHQEWLGFGPQKNFAIDQCTSEWVLSLDADEEPSSELVALLPEVITKSSPDLAGFTLARRNYFLGRPMRHGGMYPDRNGPVAKLAGDLHHHSYPTLTLYIEHMNRYSSASIPLLLGRGKRSLSFPAFVWNIVANPLATFAYNYILRGGFLDGREGLLLHLYHSVYVSWKYVKAWEQAHDGAI